jgi:hypothetical protein
MSVESDRAVEAALRKIVVEPHQLEGLHFAVFLRRDASGSHAPPIGGPAAVNTRAIERMLHYHGLSHTAKH